MEYTAEKNGLSEKVGKLIQQLATTLPASTQLKVLKELEEDIEQDYYTIMVVGEFKHGKSTFVNALLGKDLMPVDVTPTTATINAVFDSEIPELQIVKVDGQVESRPLTEVELNQFTATADFNVEEIKYLKLFMKAPLLRNRVVLIDTPGVNDLNEQRSDITFQFLPRADVIIFMTSMDAALKQTEKTFIQEFLLKNGQDKIMFAANFMDRIDEEELDDTIDFIESRIRNILHGEKASLFPISALDALTGKLTEDKNLLNFSGVPEIEREITRRIESGSRSLEKLDQFRRRLNISAKAIQSEIETAKELSSQSLESLETQVEGITDWVSRQGIWKEQLKAYLQDRNNEIGYMVNKSLQHFSYNVQEDIENRIQLFHGSDIKPLVESQIPIAIKSHFNNWVNQYSDYIHELLSKTQSEVTKGLTAAFKQNVHIHKVGGADLKYNDSIPILDVHTGNAHVKAGLAVGGVSTLGVLLGGPFFLPLVGMAGLPFLSQKVAEKQLENIKPELLFSVNRQISLLVDRFEEQIYGYLERTMKQIEEQSLAEFTRLLHSYETILKGEIASKKKEADQIQVYQESLSELAAMIEIELLEGAI